MKEYKPIASLPEALVVIDKIKCTNREIKAEKQAVQAERAALWAERDTLKAHLAAIEARPVRYLVRRALGLEGINCRP
jgi:hypothetical protein